MYLILLWICIDIVVKNYYIHARPHVCTNRSMHKQRHRQHTCSHRHTHFQIHRLLPASANTYTYKVRYKIPLNGDNIHRPWNLPLQLSLAVHLMPHGSLRLSANQSKNTRGDSRRQTRVSQRPQVHLSQVFGDNNCDLICRTGIYSKGREG